MPVYDIIVKDRNTNTYKIVGTALGTSKKSALTDYFKSMYRTIIINKEEYYIRKYTKIYGNKITRYGFNLNERDFNNLFFQHPHIVLLAKDFKPMMLNELELKQLEKAIKKPTKRVVAKKK